MVIRPDPGPAPTEASLHEAALTYLARFAATEAGLLRVLDRRIQRWRQSHPDPGAVADQVAAASKAARAVVGRLVAAGAVNDSVFAETKARGLRRAGVSRLGAAARLVAKGIDPAQARAALSDDPDEELGAALILARKRRIGPFRPAPADPTGRQKELAVLARAGFSREVAVRALTTDIHEAEARIADLRR